MVFIHIEKTAGSSIVEGLIRRNVQKDVHLQGGLRTFLRNRSTNPGCAHGHYPYGLHLFTSRPVKYFTMLRDPVDRAVSMYYFIKDLERVDLWQRHPLRDYADSVTITEFFQNPKLSNLQTRFLAGIAYHRLYPAMHRFGFFRKSMLEAAKKNLDACAAFGLQHRYDDSIRLFQSALDWPSYESIPPLAKTKKRPSIKEIEELNPAVVPALRESHALDQALFEYASTRFDAQLVEARID